MSQRLNLLAPEVRENPYPYYAKLRRESPVCQVDPHGFWAISRHDDIVAVFKNTDVFSSEACRHLSEPSWLGRSNPISNSMFLADPPRHGRLRGLANRAFTNTMLSRMEAYARDVAMRLVEMLFQSETVEFISEFALHLPASLLAMMMGLDPSLQKHLKRWSDDISGAATTPPNDLVRQEEVRKSLAEREQYVREVLQKRRSKPSNDLVSDLLQIQVEGDRLSDDELLAFFMHLLVAGLETTVFLLTHVGLILAQDPQWFHRLRHNEVLIARFIEEVLRYEPPAHTTLRLTTREVEVSGVQLPANAMVLLLLASGLRDEAHYTDPERFDPERGIPSSLAFGHGIHFCLGAPLARMEARVALDAILSMCSRFDLAIDRLEWSNSLTMRSPLSLPLRITPI